MKKIDTIIHWKLLEISIMLSVIMISFPLWKYLGKEELNTTAAFYDSANYTHLNIEEVQNGPMFPLKNEKALEDLKPSKLSVINETKTTEDYTILMKIKKSSSMDYHYLNIAFDQWIVPLKNLYQKEDENYFYFNITSNRIRGEVREHSFLIWLDESTGNEMMNKSLDYTFELQKGVMI